MRNLKKVPHFFYKTIDKLNPMCYIIITKKNKGDNKNGSCYEIRVRIEVYWVCF